MPSQSLAKVSGTVQSVIKEGEAISSVTLTDGTNDFRLLFNNYIGYSDESSPDITTFVKEGAEISAVGVIYMDPEGVCLRVRDLSEVQLVEDEPSEPEDPNEPDVPVNPNPSYAITVEQPDHGTVTADPAAARTNPIRLPKDSRFFSSIIIMPPILSLCCGFIVSSLCSKLQKT